MESKSKFINFNNSKKQHLDEYGVPLNGERIYADDYDNGKKTILRFRDGYLDGDLPGKNGKIIQKPAVESEGHQEYWRQNHLHRDNGEPAVYTENFTITEFWENGVRIENQALTSEKRSATNESVYCGESDEA